jgi:transposase
MDVVYQRCCGLDVHRRTVVACLLTPDGRTVRTFGTTLTALLELGAWLLAAQVEAVAMESTGVYWKPVYNVLEVHDLTIQVVNAQHLKTVPGRKTDVNDAEWLADLLRLGLLRGSLIPSREQRELRELVRYRTSLVAVRAAEVNRIQALLTGANINTKQVASDILGRAGRAILDAVAAGETAPERLAALGEGRLRTPPAARQAALTGTLGVHQREVLRLQLAHIDFLDQQLATVEATISTRLAPHSDALARLDTIPGVGLRTAEVIVTELGTDMSRFPSAGHAAAWAGLSPGQHESGGTRQRAPTRRGNRFLRAALVEAARAAARSRGTVLGRTYQRLVPRLGTARAAVALARKILVIAYYLLRDGGIYHEPTPALLPAHVRDRRRRRALQELAALGYAVTLTPVAVPA